MEMLFPLRLEIGSEGLQNAAPRVSANTLGQDQSSLGPTSEYKRQTRHAVFAQHISILIRVKRDI